MPNIIYSSKKRRGIAGKRLGDVSEQENAAIKARASQPFLPFNEALLADDDPTTTTARSHHPTSVFRKSKSSIKKVTPAVLHDDVWCLDGPQDSDEDDEDETDVNLLAEMSPVQSPSQPPTPVRHNLHETTSRRNIYLGSADNRVVEQGTDVVPPFAPAVSSTTSKNNSTTTTPTAPPSSSTARSKRRSRKVTVAGIQAQKLQFSSAKHPQSKAPTIDQDTRTPTSASLASSSSSCARCLQFGTELETFQHDRSQHHEQMKQQTAQHQAEVDALRESHQQEVDQLTQQHAQQIQSLTESHTQQTDHSKTLAESLHQQINELQTLHSRQLQNLRESKERAEREHDRFAKRQDALFHRLAESLPGCPSPDQYDGNMEAWYAGVVDLAAADSVRRNVRIQDLQASSEKKERTVLDYREKLRQREAEISGLKRRLALVDPQYRSMGSSTTETNNKTNASSGTGVAAHEGDSRKRMASETPLQGNRDCKRRRRSQHGAIRNNDVKACPARQTPPFLRTIYAQDPFPLTQSSREEEKEDKSTHRLLFPESRPSQATTYRSNEEELTVAMTPRLKLTKVNLKRAKKSKVARTPLVK